MNRIKHKLISYMIPPIPVSARHAEYSAIISTDDDPAEPSDRLFDCALEAVNKARSVSLDSITARMIQPPYYPNVWPGEHYKLLAGLVTVCQPKLVIEIGTATGLSALTMHTYLPAGSRLITFDIIPWNQFSDTIFCSDDFNDETLSQLIGDLSDPAVMQQHAGLLRSADLIFADGPKDGRFEQIFLDRLAELSLSQAPLLILDDIRVWNMLGVWRNIRYPKLDLTSFGHWSGTGLVDWSGHN